MRRTLTTASRLLEPALASSSRRLPRAVLVASSSRVAATPLPVRIQLFRVPAATRSHSTAAVAPPEPIPPISAEDTYDIVIIGGGPAGLALASALVSHKTIRDTTRILLLEGGSLDPVRNWDDQGGWSNRVSSLTAENIEWLESIGAWKHIALPRSCAVEDIIVWANPDADATPMLHFPGNGEVLARMTENINTQRALLRRLEEAPAGVVTVREGVRVNEMRYGEGRGWVGLRVGDSWVRGSLVIGADGPNSPVRAFAQIDTFGHAYNAHGVVATLEHRPDPVWPNHTAFQRFLPTGPLAFLPLSEENSTMVWSTTPELAAALKRLDPAALTIAINAGFTLPEAELGMMNEAILDADAQRTPLSADALNGILASFPEVAPTEAPVPRTITGVQASSVASFPLRLSHADQYTAHRIALVGDAAHTTHPLAGQGLNAGLADARVLANTLDRARAVGSDLGGITALAPYPRERYLPNHVMLAAVDKLNSVFGSRNPLINWARGTGLEVINELGPLKSFFMANAGSGAKGAPRTGADREFARSRASDPLYGRPAGLPAFMADAAEAFEVASKVVTATGNVLAEGLKNALRRGADSLEKK